MAGTMSRGASWNPLDCRGTALPPNLLLMAKLIVLFLLCRQAFDTLSDHFLPFLPFFDRLGRPETFRLVLQVICYASAAGLVFNRAVRACAFTLGAALLVSIVSSRVLFSNNRTFMACLLVLIGLHEPGQPPWLLRCQIALLYLGSGLNKLFDPDWRTGYFVEFWTGEILHQTTYQTVAGWLPPMTLSMLVGWGVILAELGLAALFLMRRRYSLAICLGILLHTGMLVFSHGQLSIVFYYAMLVSYLAFVDWPPDGAEPATLRDRILYHPATYVAFALLIVKPGVLVPWKVYRAALALPVLCFPVWMRLFTSSSRQRTAPANIRSETGSR